MNMLLLPVAFPLGLAFVALAVNAAWLGRWLVAAAGCLMAAVGTLALVDNLAGTIPTVAVGGHAAPFGIALAADGLSSLMLVVTGLLSWACASYRFRDSHERSGSSHALTLLLLASVSGSVLTADLFNLYVWFEVMVLASAGLLALTGDPGRLDGVIKYTLLNVVGAAFLLLGVALIYGITGTLSFADLAARPRGVSDPQLSGAVVVVLVAFLLKAAAFPLFFWLPASYPTLGFATAGLFSGLMSKVGVYTLYRSLLTLFPDVLVEVNPMLVVLSIATMLTGVLGAAAQHDVKRILSFHTVSQIGYLMMGLAIATRDAVSAGLFFLVHVIVVKSALFLVGGVAAQFFGSAELRDGGGLLVRGRWVTVCFGLLAASLAGVPPFSGFWAKLGLIVAGLDAGHAWLVATAVLTGLLTLYSMTKIWQTWFWRETPEALALSAPPGVGLSCWALFGVVLLFSAWPQGLFSVAQSAATQLFERAAYVTAVQEAQ